MSEWRVCAAMLSLVLQEPTGDQVDIKATQEGSDFRSIENTILVRPHLTRCSWGGEEGVERTPKSGPRRGLGDASLVLSTPGSALPGPGPSLASSRQLLPHHAPAPSPSFGPTPGFSASSLQSIAAPAQPLRGLFLLDKA